VSRGARGEVAVIGLGASGRAAALLLARDGVGVYASDGGESPATHAAAADLRAVGVTVDLGRHDLDRIARARLAVLSPGVPPTAAAVRAARDAGVPVVSEIEIGLAHLPGVPYIAVTGTNGKTTTTALVGHLLRALGHHAIDAGNIGLPLSAVAMDAGPAGRRPDWIALELSSFQLHDTPSVAPVVAVLTNLSPDHLDRYPSAAAYYADKARLFANAGPDSIIVSNADDPAVQAMVAAVPGRRFTFSAAGGAGVSGGSAAVYRRPPAGAPDRAVEGTGDGGWLDLLGVPLLQRSQFPLLGDHNVANALAAVLSVALAHPSHATPEARARLASGLRSFRALPHRLQLVGEYGGVQWIDDSKATNVSSARVALESMVRPTIALLGGRHKGEPYTSLGPPLRQIGKVVLAYGEAAPMIDQDLGGVIPVERLGSDFAAVMARAHAHAAAGDAVLLAPACSSFDMFRNYEERGATFARLAAARS